MHITIEWQIKNKTFFLFFIFSLDNLHKSLIHISDLNEAVKQTGNGKL